MLLAVAGLNKVEVKQRTKKLADGDWSDFPPAERLGYRFVHTLAKQPWAVNENDSEQLKQSFGEHRAIDIIWYGAWCNYMTRVADAFQLQLESDNVFAGRKQKSKAPESPKKR